MRCDLRTHSECGCSGKCVAAQPAPVFIPTWRDHVAFVLASGIAAGFIAVGFCAAEQNLSKHDFPPKEITRHG